MKLVNNGPDFPLEILRALEDGELVLFCGAGVSAHLGLPLFRDLVEKVYEKLSESKDEIERIAFDAPNYDRVMGHLENRLGVARVRRAVAEALQVPPDCDLEFHKALVSLSTDAITTEVRLVTTNFDEAFVRSVQPENISVDIAPRIPIPKRYKWNSIVQLHGLITSTDPEGRSLVLSSADFGAAYLTEGWATRFIAEVFRKFVVLFVGYRVEDPMVRYMLDAFAADRDIGEGVRNAYVLVGVEGAETEEEKLWHAKNVTPILYDKAGGHIALRTSLIRLASIHMQGLLGRETLMRNNVHIRPTHPYDEQVSQVAWAMKEPSGRVARAFAAVEPCPDIAWLDALESFGVLEPETGEGTTSFSHLVSYGFGTLESTRLSAVQHGVVLWLARLLSESALLDWVIDKGSCLHPEFRDLVRRKLEKFSPLPKELWIAWKVLSNPHIRIASKNDLNIFQLATMLVREGWSPLSRVELRAALRPAVEVQKTLNWPRIHWFQDADADESYSRVPMFDIRIEGADSLGDLGNAIGEAASAAREMWETCDIFTIALLEYWNLSEIVQRVGPSEDGSYYQRPSISEHSQNHDYEDWAKLVTPLCTTFLSLVEKDRKAAQTVMDRWRGIRYPLFRRLALFGAAHSGLLRTDEQVDMALEDGGYWIWSNETERECYELLRKIWLTVKGREKERVMSVLIKGPSRSKFGVGLSRKDWKRDRDRMVWARLGRLDTVGHGLTRSGRMEITRLRKEYPQWQYPPNEIVEFPSWVEISSGIETNYTVDELLDIRPTELMRVLASHQERRRGLLDQWRVLAKKRPRRAITILIGFKNQNCWLPDVWRGAFNGLREDECIGRGLRYLGEAISVAEDQMLEEASGPIANWFRQTTKGLSVDKEHGHAYWETWDRCMDIALRLSVESYDNVVSRAINHPVGILVEALLERLGARSPKVGDGLPDTIRNRMDLVIEDDGEASMLGSVIIFSRLHYLFAVDPHWCRNTLLSLLKWTDNPNAALYWQGYLWAARISVDLIHEVKGLLLKGVGDGETVGVDSRRMTELLCVAVMVFPEEFELDEVKQTLRTSGAVQRAEMARTMARLLRETTNRDQYFYEKVVPLLRHGWPQDIELRDRSASHSLALIAVYSEGAFNEAVELIRPLLIRTSDWSFVVHELNKSALPDEAPESTLSLLEAIIDTDKYPVDRELREVLDRVVASDYECRESHAFRHLEEYLLRHV